MGRGCRGEPLLSTAPDREHFAFLLGDVAERFEWTIANWVLMPNHHHLLVRLKEPNLDEGMHRLHGLFAQRWNIRNGGSGHVFFRRYKNVVLRRAGAPGRVSRYLDLNPVRAGLCSEPEEWTWSGYAAIVGKRQPERFHAASEALRMVSADYIGVGAQLEYARSVRQRLATARTARGHLTSRPWLREIIVPGDLSSLREAHETWWYSTREIATTLDVSVATVHRWLTKPPEERTGAALKRWLPSP